MRMNQSAELTAKDVLNTYEEGQLHKILGMYGEVKNAKTLAQAIVAERAAKPFDTTEGFTAFLKKYAPRGKEFKYFAQIFQALRIVVNEEMAVLEEFLQQVPDVLTPKGRLVVMSYHSLEDRPVKNFIRSGKFSGEVEKDFFGNEIKPMVAVNRKPIEATPEEIQQNPRARSAKLRIATLYNAD